MCLSKLGPPLCLPSLWSCPSNHQSLIKKSMISHLSVISPIPTSHGVGRKRVLLSKEESKCSLTQIAITELKAGEVAPAHIHPDMQEAFYVLEGELEMTLDGERNICPQETFIYVDKGTSHELKALTDCRVMTVGCEVN